MLRKLGASIALLMVTPVLILAQEPAPHGGGEANLRLPDLAQVNFLGIDGRSLLLIGIAVCVLGLLFGLATYMQLKKLPVHRSMREDLRADLRNVQDLPHHAGQIHPHPRSIHCCHHRSLFRSAA